MVFTCCVSTHLAFALKVSRLMEACLPELITGPLKGMPLNMQKTDPFTEQSDVDGRATRTVKTGEKSVIKLGEKK